MAETRPHPRREQVHPERAHFWSLQMVLRRNAAWLGAEEDKPAELIALAIARDQFQACARQEDAA